MTNQDAVFVLWMSDKTTPDSLILHCRRAFQAHIPKDFSLDRAFDVLLGEAQMKEGCGGSLALCKEQEGGNNFTTLESQMRWTSSHQDEMDQQPGGYESGNRQMQTKTSLGLSCIPSETRTALAGLAACCPLLPLWGAFWEPSLRHDSHLFLCLQGLVIIY